MTQHSGGVPPQFTVIDGGAVAPRITSQPLPPAPQFCKDELAAEMAQMFVLALVQDLPLAQLKDPHCVVPGLGPGEVTLHHLLCELRNLRWFDAEYLLSPTPWAAFSPALSGDPDRRRSRNWNRDGQLTLPIAMRGPVAHRGPARADLLSRGALSAPELPDLSPPSASAGMGHWLDWCCAARAARPSGDRGDRAETELSLRDLTRCLPGLPAAQPFLAIVLDALAAKQPLDDGIRDQPGWTGPRLLSLLVEAEALARGMARRAGLRDDRAMRPAVSAARLSLRLSREDRAGQTDTLSAAAQDLAYAAPRLLEWVHQVNRRHPAERRLSRSLFLPLTQPDDLPVHPADLAEHVIVAGALATLIKALFDTSALADAAPEKTGRLRASDLDGLCADVALARCAAGTHFPAENHQDLRIGEAIALSLLRAELETGNRAAALSLTDFDGDRLELRCHERNFGRGSVAFLRGGLPSAWPMQGRAAGHLTAVS